MKLPWQEESFARARGALARGAHALLLSGQRGLGKRELALRLAAALLCDASGDAEDACGICASCLWLRAGSHPDFWLVEPITDEAEEGEEKPRKDLGGRSRPITIDQIRGLTERIGLTSHRSGGKVVVIAPAEAMNAPAANALLKSLEEPPPGTVFLLVSHRPAFLLATVRSRCQTVPLRLDDPVRASAWLEGQGVPEAPLRLAFAGGAALDALRSAEDPLWPRRKAFLQGLANREGDGIAYVETTCKDLPPAIALAWLQKWTFDLVLARASGTVRYNLDFADRIPALASRLEPVALTRYHRLLLRWQRSAHHPFNARLFLEQMLVRYFMAVRSGAAAVAV